MVKIRLKRIGATKNPIYRVVVTDEKSKRDGRVIEEVGFYRPTTNPAEVRINADAVKRWIKNGAQPTDVVKKLLKKNAVI